jgi:hypothetical protein
VGLNRILDTFSREVNRELRWTVLNGIRPIWRIASIQYWCLCGTSFWSGQKYRGVHRVQSEVPAHNEWPSEEQHRCLLLDQLRNGIKGATQPVDGLPTPCIWRDSSICLVHLLLAAGDLLTHVSLYLADLARLLARHRTRSFAILRDLAQLPATVVSCDLCQLGHNGLNEFQIP